ncbi:MAG TPA: formimidoylglutamase [Flavobacterium sp.]|nr:formimidoylglutamase [Flavobacterium sp.]
MENIILFTQSDLTQYTSHRSGEIKFGERILTIPPNEKPKGYITNCDAQFVLIGVPEDIGVRANFGRPGTSSAWGSAIKSIVNLQHNKFCKGSNLLILGQVDTTKAMEQAATLDATSKEGRKALSELVETIDRDVAHIICLIVAAGKIPIVIGGGHNNAYGNIKGTALAKGKPVNAVNFDAHTDFRQLEGRHSGNGFSYAFDEGFLKNYFIFGLHENYASKGVMENIRKNEERIQFNTYEEIAVRKEKSFSAEKTNALEFVQGEPFGIEIDLDSLPNVASSAMTPSGFSIERARQFVHYMGQHENAAYLHLCEGAPDLDNEKTAHLTGKLIAYLVTDFMKARANL